MLQFCWVLAAQTNSFEEHFQAALGKLKSGDLAEAEKFARLALDVNRQSAQGWALLGMVHEQGGQFGPAVEEFQRAISLAPELKIAHLRLGVVYYRQGDKTRAAGEFESVLRSDPNDPAASLQLGQIRLEERQYQAALDLLTAARRTLGDDARLLLSLAECQLGLGRKPEADELLAAFDQNAQRNAEVLYQAGTMLLEHQEATRGLDYLTRASALSPGHPAILIAMAEAQLRSGQAKEANESIDRFVNALRTGSLPPGLRTRLIGKAREVFENEKGIEQTPENRFLFAEVLFLAKDYRKALEVLGPLAEASKTNPDYFNLVGMSHAGLDQLKVAGETLQEALRLAPDRLDLMFNLATVYQKANDNETAASLFQRVLERNPNLPHAYFGLGVSWFNLGKHAEAAKAFEKAIEAEPRLQEARIFLGRAQAALGQAQEARETYETAVSLSPACEDCRLRLALNLLDTESNDQAAEQLRELIRLNPRHAEGHYQLGKLLAAGDKNEEAAEELELAIKFDPNLDAAYYQLGRVYPKIGKQEKAKEVLALLASNKKKRLEAYQEKVSPDTVAPADPARRQP